MRCGGEKTGSGGRPKRREETQKPGGEETTRNSSEALGREPPRLHSTNLPPLTPASLSAAARHSASVPCCPAGALLVDAGEPNCSSGSPLSGFCGRYSRLETSASVYFLLYYLSVPSFALVKLSQQNLCTELAADGIFAFCILLGWLSFYLV